ncbi:MAG: lysophospholipid acyltransferase family protein [Holophaga sp.]|nr:lysophospholipid acyltransferase family protein [Holophaga sp.]
MTGWRSRWFWTLPVTLWGLVSLPLTAGSILAAAPFMGGRRAFWTIAPLWARAVFWLCGEPPAVFGWADLPEAIRSEREPVIFMSNHESNLDPPVLISAIPIPAVYLSKKELMWMFPVGWAAKMAGTIFIDRSNRERAIHSLHQAAAEIRGGKSVVIFPEGTRTRTGQLLPFKKGGFAMAEEAGVQIVPLATVGGRDMLPPGAVHVRPGRYVVAFGAPVDPKAFPTRDALIREVHKRISDLRELAIRS